MGQSLGTLDFFLLESGEYLDRLDVLAQTPAGPFPGAEEFLRVSRAFRGSAIMANQHGMARAAQGIESCARAIREGRLPWAEGTRAELIRAVDDCRVLMRRLRSPEHGDNDRAEAIGVRLDRFSGRASAVLRASASSGLDAGSRAFVARETAAIASVLQQVARALSAEPPAREALGRIGAAMSALRGVAVLGDLPPLGDILGAVESAVKEVAASPGAVPRATAEAFEAGARALARAAREVVERGRPDAQSSDAQLFAERLLAMVGRTVPVESLFYDDDGPHIVTEGRPHVKASLARVEMVGQGEYLTQATADLAQASSSVQRDLRLFGMAASLRSLSEAGDGLAASALADFAAAVRGAIGRGTASQAPDEFARALRAAAAALIAAQAADDQQLARQLGEAARGLAALGGAEAPPPAVAPAPAVIVPAAAPPPPAPAAGAAPTLGEADLATSYMTLEQLIADRGLPLGTLEELVGSSAAEAAPPDMRPIVPIESLAPDEAQVVPIESLLYRGETALRRVLELQSDLLAAARAPDGGARLQALLSEVLDLVSLGLIAGR